jgi:agmatine deiminase
MVPPMKKINLLPLFALFLLALTIGNPKRVLAQEDSPKKVVHWLTPEEKLHFFELVGKNFVETDPPSAPSRNIAEFDEMQGALVRYPFGIPITIMKEISEDIKVTTIVLNAAQQNTVTQQYIAAGVNMANCDFLLAPSDSYWTRDYGPWYISDSSNNMGIVDFPYNRPSRPNDDEIPKLVANMLGIPWYGMNVIHTGGNYMTDGMGISSSTQLVWEENPTQTHEQIAQKFKDYLNIDNYMVVEDPNNTYIDHIDCWGKFLAPDKILIRKVPPTHPQYDAIEATAAYYASQPCSYGYNYRVYRVNTPQNQPYTNSVILNNKVLVPFMNSSWDDSAKVAYQAAMPGYEIIGFTGNPSTPWESTDALHCRVMGIADLGMLYIRHIPIAGTVPAEQNYSLTAQIIACSDSALYSDSLLIWYRVNGGAWHNSLLTHTTGENYSGYIPEQAGGSTIQYYLYAADHSGRNATSPFIGASDPFTFQTSFTQLTAVPDTLWFETVEDCFNGKTTNLFNYSSGPIEISEVQMYGNSYLMWGVDSLTVMNLPYSLPASDSFFIRIHVGLPLNNSPLAGYLKDSMMVTTSAGIEYIMIMVNEELYSSVATVPVEKMLYLGQGYPNPFKNYVTIPYTVSAQDRIRIEVFNMQGLLVRTIYEGMPGAGLHEITWDGFANNGNILQPGIYLYRLTDGQKSITRRVVLVR